MTCIASPTRPNGCPGSFTGSTALPLPVTDLPAAAAGLSLAAAGLSFTSLFAAAAGLFAAAAGLFTAAAALFAAAADFSRPRPTFSRPRPAFPWPRYDFLRPRPERPDFLRGFRGAQVQIWVSIVAPVKILAFSLMCHSNRPCPTTPPGKSGDITSHPRPDRWDDH